MNSCVVDHDGNAVARESKRFWLVPHFREEICRRCGMCSRMCPAGIITKPSEQAMPSLSNAKMCASCHWCEKVCAYNAIVFAPAKAGEEVKSDSQYGEQP